MAKRTNSWDSDDTFGSDIHGFGQVFGDIAGKVKTAQIGFVRSPRRQVRGKASVSDKGRSQSNAASGKQGKR